MQWYKRNINPHFCTTWVIYLSLGFGFAATYGFAFFILLGGMASKLWR